MEVIIGIATNNNKTTSQWSHAMLTQHSGVRAGKRPQHASKIKDKLCYYMRNVQKLFCLAIVLNRSSESNF